MSSITAVWVVVVAAVLWFVYATASTAAVIGIAAIGVAPLIVLFFLARRPEPTTAEAISQAKSGRPA
jgi:hypothetical protein